MEKLVATPSMYAYSHVISLHLDSHGEAAGLDTEDPPRIPCVDWVSFGCVLRRSHLVSSRQGST